MATTVTNSQINTLAAAVPAPYGPLTRVTDVSTLPTPNSEISLQFTLATGETVWMTYEQLQVAATVQRLARQAANFEGRLRNIAAWVAEVYAITNSLAASDYDYEHYLEVITMLQDTRNPLPGYYMANW